MSKKQSIIDEIAIIKDSFLKDLSSEEKKEMEIYFESMILEFSPMLEIFEKMSIDKNITINITKSVKEEIEEQKWLEKLSKTFYDQERIQDLMKTQTE
jgi:hypothetical protein